MSIVNGALYDQKRGQPMSRKQLKAIRQRKAETNKREGICSYKANHTIDFFEPKWGKSS